MQKYFEAHQLWQSQLTKEEQELRTLLKRVQRELSHAPEGSLTIATQGNRTWYRHRLPGGPATGTYIRHGNLELICKLAQKRYDTLLCCAIEQELAQLNKGKVLTFHDIGNVYNELPELYKPFVEPHVLPDDLYVERWLEDFRKVASGDAFKSKAEHIHNMIFNEQGTPHVYEPRLYLDGFGTIRPDFVLLNVRTRQTFYHEHFGMMDNPDYCAKALSKLNHYHHNGFYEGENLLITMESSEHPMNPEEVTQLFRHYLL